MNLKLAKAPTKEEMKRESPFLTHQIFITKAQVEEFENLLAESAGKRKIDEFLVTNPEVFTSAIQNFRTGHHGAMIIPKQVIRPRIKTIDDKGLVPDFIIGGKNSDGWDWWVVELKGSNQNLFSQTNSDTYFSSEINKGICQLLEYIDFCSENQSNLRDTFKLEDFREPHGLLITGRESEVLENSKKQKLKAAWNRLNTGKLEIHTYDFMRRNLRALFELHNKQVV